MLVVQKMPKISPGKCVRIPDGRIGRVRDLHDDGLWRIRVKRTTSNTNQFLYFKASQLKLVTCPQGWMGEEGYNNYVKKTLAKMNLRNARK